MAHLLDLNVVWLKAWMFSRSFSNIFYLLWDSQNWSLMLTFFNSTYILCPPVFLRDTCTWKSLHIHPGAYLSVFHLCPTLKKFYWHIMTYTKMPIFKVCYLISFDICMWEYNNHHHHNQNNEYIYHSKSFFVPFGFFYLMGFLAPLYLKTTFELLLITID